MNVRILPGGHTLCVTRVVTMTFMAKGESPSDRRQYTDLTLKQFGLKRDGAWADNKAVFKCSKNAP